MIKLIKRYSWSAAPGNTMLIILIAYVAADIFTNKKMSASQLAGKLILAVFLMFLLFMRGRSS